MAFFLKMRHMNTKNEYINMHYIGGKGEWNESQASYVDYVIFSNVEMFLKLNKWFF